MTTMESTTSFASSAFGALARSFRIMRARRAQRLAVRALLDMDRGQLDDLGIDIEDVRDAFAAPEAGQHLARRRRARASNWAPKGALVGQH
jgi:uncharacterized protein YjiS (DUF1127 family)